MRSFRDTWFWKHAVPIFGQKKTMQFMQKYPGKWIKISKGASKMEEYAHSPELWRLPIAHSAYILGCSERYMIVLRRRFGHQKKVYKEQIT